jgi:putative transcriptional regulator
MGEKRINMRELHRITGLSTNTIFKLYHNKTSNISFATLAKLCEALECSVGELFEYIPDKSK